MKKKKGKKESDCKESTAIKFRKKKEKSFNINNLEVYLIHIYLL